MFIVFIGFFVMQNKKTVIDEAALKLFM